MIRSIEHHGMLIGACGLPGERRADNVFPAHANGLQLSRDRWMIVYSTRGFRGIDDEWSIVYQLRTDAPDGRVLREGFLARGVPDWEPSSAGLCAGRQGRRPHRKLWKQHGHAVLFGVPKGAHRAGRPLPHANVFVAKWRVLGVPLTRDADGRERLLHDKEISRRTQGVEWMQFRLNESGDDIDVLQPAAPLRQNGFGTGPQFCSLAEVACMNQTYVPAVPLNADASEWVDCCHFDQSRIAALRYRFNSATGRYEWAQTGALLGGPDQPLFEASVVRWRDNWIIAARQGGSGSGEKFWPNPGVVWARVDDLFQKTESFVVPADPPAWAPLAAFCGGDGTVRLLTGDPVASPYQNGRAPLYMWAIDPDNNFASSDRRVVFDPVAAQLPLTESSGRIADMGKLLSPHGGRQMLIHRVRAKAIDFPANTKAVITPEQKACCGVYCAHVDYTEPAGDAWEFE